MGRILAGSGGAVLHLQVESAVVVRNKPKDGYIIGVVRSDYLYRKGRSNKGFHHQREVHWVGFVKSSSLNPQSVSSLNSGNNVANIRAEVLNDILDNMDSIYQPTGNKERIVSELGKIQTTEQRELLAQRIANAIKRLGHDTAMELLSDIFRAKGLHSQTFRHFDMGVDIFASADSMGVVSPLIAAQVKAQKEKIKPGAARSFKDSVPPFHIGVFLSLSGFSAGAKRQLNSENKYIKILNAEDLSWQVIEFIDDLNPENVDRLNLHLPA